MNVTLLVNDQDELCFTHDAPLAAAPVRLITNARGTTATLELADGSQEDFGRKIDTELAGAVSQAETALIVELREDRAIGGSEVPVVRG